MAIFVDFEVQNRFCEKRSYLALDMAAVSDGSDWIGARATALRFVATYATQFWLATSAI